jgi:hypothetical protein
MTRQAVRLCHLSIADGALTPDCPGPIELELLATSPVRQRTNTGYPR